MDNSYIENLAKKLLMILMEKVDGKLTATELQKRHLEKFGKPLTMDDIMLLSEQKDFIEVCVTCDFECLDVHCFDHLI